MQIIHGLDGNLLMNKYISLGTSKMQPLHSVVIIQIHF